MTKISKSGGLQHAYSLGNIDTSTRHGTSSRNYDSEDENIGRRKPRSNASSYPKPSVYSKADIQEQYCVSERQRHTYEHSKREGFFGCWSSHNPSPSFLSVCVGRRNPSDENLADSAPFYKYPRNHPHAINGQHGIMRNGDDAENSYFKRKPTSFLCSNDSKRFTWAKDGSQVNESGAANQQLDNAPKMPFVIDSHMNQTGSYRCPSHHVGMTTSILTAADSTAAPRTKHVSFARSHTLTSFDDFGSLARSASRMSTTKSQERLIGGKKVTNSPEPQTHLFNLNNQPLQDRKQHFQIASPFVGTNISHSPSETAMIEKLKRNAMKTQATQTDVFANRRLSMRSNISSVSPRSFQCESMNGNFIGRKLMKSLSEAATRRRDDYNGESIVPSDDMLRQHQIHDPLFRTQSEEPRSPRDINESLQSNSAFMNYDMFSHGSSHISDLETHGSATSGRFSASKASEESLPFSLSESDEYCSTCSSETDSKEEKEIFIDFKPSVTPIRKRSAKYDDEMHNESVNEDVLITSTSEEDIRMRDEYAKSYAHTYSNIPVRHEDNLLKLPSERDVNANNRRDAFRKRSISLEKANGDESEFNEYKPAKSGPASPCLEDKHKHISTYPSSDSLLNDSAREHSDGNWNESQATVLQIEPNAFDSGATLSTATLKRKTLSLQHQHSSVDIEALEIEDQFHDQSPASTSGTLRGSISPNSEKTIVPSAIQSKTPSIAVIPSVSMEAEDFERFSVHRKSLPSTIISSRQNTRRKSAEPIVHIYSNVKSELLKNVPIAKSLSDQQPFNRGSDKNKNATDLSECSTNTDDYLTCTEASKRGTLPTTASSSSTTHAPVPTQGSQTLTQNGSSFESASSVYSLARVENICDDAQVPITEDTLPLPPALARKPSPSHSISSSSSGSYFNGKKPSRSASPRSSVVVQASGVGAVGKVKPDLPSDGEKSEKRHSSSGYYESPHEDDACRLRRRDWNDDDRRKRKEKMRLEMNNVKSATSPTKKTGICFKRISADDRTALHILDGTNQTKSKRNRPKTRRSPRTRIGNEDVFTRKLRPQGASPEGAAVESCSSRYCAQQVPQISPKKPSPETRLKALSTESLRSVSPGSDSVFYSEADVHCHHCGKEVEIVTAVGEGDDSYFAQDENQANIVKPPADFADSPNGVRPSHRLYKKLDKRFRSEERHGDRKHYRSRQSSTRAKSEERNKDDASTEHSMRPAGSTPCVTIANTFNVRDSVADPEQGIYHGFYRLGLWICIADRDVWRRPDLLFNQDRPRDINDRRPSTESEKDFRKKYQAITHRLVHRKSCIEMYRRQSNNCTDKSIVVRRESGEFGFRIHGSKPVVVSAIEPETPAETSGLEIGDIILSVNGVSVIDKSHSEVVKIAHAGSDVLELEVARTLGILSSDTLEAPSPSLYSGFLWRRSSSNSEVPICQKWVRRWFCLKTDHCLYFYKSDQESQPIGAILLTNHTIESCAADIDKPFAFRIKAADGSAIYLAAENEEAANRWIAVICHASKQSDQWLDLSTRNFRLPPSNVPRPDCFGYLLLQGNKWRTWSKRYCVLKDACLYFYLDGSSKNAIGMTCLQGYKVQPANNAVGKKYAFEITPPESKLRNYCFSTDSDMDKKRWIAALEYSIDR